jgi:outer membrane lipoprotein-sorting protein
MREKGRALWRQKPENAMKAHYVRRRSGSSAETPNARGFFAPMTLARLFAVLTAGLALAAPAAAQQFSDVPPPPGVQLAATNKGVPVARLDAAQRATLQRVNAYFNSLNSIVADFQQTAPDGSRTAGKLYLVRPGKLRFQYAPPSPLEIVSNGTSILVKNRRLATQEIWPLSQTPLRFLTSDNIDLLKDANVTGVYQEQNFVSVVLEEKNAIGGKAQLQLLFSGRDYALTQWTVTDAQGQETSVALSNVEPVRKIDDRMFEITTPRWPTTRRP